MVSGLAPGRFAETEIVGYSTWGNAATGSMRKAMIPTSASAIVSRVVAIGRLIKGAERFMWLAWMCSEGVLCGDRCGASLTNALGDTVERKIDHRSRIQREDLTDDQSSNDGDAKRAAKLRSDSRADRQRQRAEQRRHRRHHNRSKTQEAGFVDRFDGRLALLAFRLKGKIDHHDGVFLHDPDQQNDADEG